MVAEDLMMSVSGTAPLPAPAPPIPKKKRNRAKVDKAGSVTLATSADNPPAPQATIRESYASSATSHSEHTADAQELAERGSVHPSALDKPVSNATPWATSDVDVSSAEATAQNHGQPRARVEDPSHQSTELDLPLQPSLISTSSIGDVVSTTEAVDPIVIMDDEENAIVLDPANSARQYCDEPFKKDWQREVWRPGDGDGHPNSDNRGRVGFIPMHDRWRLYQSETGDSPISKANAPPKFVILDDKAVVDVMNSNIAKGRMLQWWPHDFAGSGTIRDRRPHRGRPSIEHPEESGDARFYKVEQGQYKHKYYFKGAHNYKPIIYRSPPKAPAPEQQPDEHKATTPAQPEKRKEPSPVPDPPPTKRRGHNQHTPAEELVKNGAQSFRAKPRNRTSYISPFLHDRKRGRHAVDFDRTNDQLSPSGPSPMRQDTPSASDLGSAPGDEEDDGFWVSRPDEHEPAVPVPGENEPVDSYRDFSVFDDPSSFQDTSADQARSVAEDMPTKRDEVTRRRSFFEQDASDDEGSAHQTHVRKPNATGVRLEAQLLEAKDEVGRLTESLTAAHAKIENLETELKSLRVTFATTTNDTQV